MNIVGFYDTEDLGQCILGYSDTLNKEKLYKKGLINKKEFIDNIYVEFGSYDYKWNLLYHTDKVFSIYYNHDLLGPIYIYEDSDYISLKFTEDKNMALKFEVEDKYLRVVDHPYTEEKLYLVGVDEYHKLNNDTFFMLGTLNNPVYYNVSSNFDYMILGDLEFCFEFKFEYSVN